MVACSESVPTEAFVPLTVRVVATPILLKSLCSIVCIELTQMCWVLFQPIDQILIVFNQNLRMIGKK